MTTPPKTYGDLVNFKLPTFVVAAGSQAHKTTPYYGGPNIPVSSCVARAVPQTQESWSPIIKNLEKYMRQKGVFDTELSPDTKMKLQPEELFPLDNQYREEREVSNWFVGIFIPVIKSMKGTLFDSNVRVGIPAPSHGSTTHGDESLEILHAVAVELKAITILETYAANFKQPKVFRDWNRQAEGSRAILAKLSMHMASPFPYDDKPTDWGIIFSLNHVHICRKVAAKNGDRVMLVSQRFNCTGDGADTIPFLAVLLGLLLAPPEQVTEADEEVMQDRQTWPFDEEDVGGDHGKFIPEMDGSDSAGPSGPVTQSTRSLMLTYSTPDDALPNLIAASAPSHENDIDKTESTGNVTDNLVVRLDATLHIGPDASTMIGRLGSDTVVVKIFRPEMRKSAVKEMQILKLAGHRCRGGVPKIIGLFGMAAPNKRTYLVQEWCGEPPASLQDLSVDDKETIRALYVALHQQGIRHGDISAGNIVQHPESRTWTLIDFGLASLGHRCIASKCQELFELDGYLM